MWEGIVREAETDLAFASIQDASTKGSGKIDSMEVSADSFVQLAF
jgi:hypothetical protein